MQDFKPRYSPLFILLLDGWGLSTSWRHTALPEKVIPNLTHLWHNYPHAALRSLEILRGRYASVTDTSCAYETLGSGTTVLQPAAAIASAIHDGSFYDNLDIKAIVASCSQSEGILHLVGHISFVKNYSYLEHLYAIIRVAIAQDVKAIKCHLVIDQSAVDAIDQWLPPLLRLFDDLDNSGVATISGMDQSTKAIAHAITGQSSATTSSAIAFLRDCATKGLKGESITPTIVLDRDGRRNEWDEHNYLFFFDLANAQTAQLVRTLCERPYAKRFMGDKEVLAGSLVQQDGIEAQIKTAFAEKPVRGTLLEILSQYHFKTSLSIFKSSTDFYLKSFTGQNVPRWPGIDITTVDAGSDANGWQHAVTHMVNEAGKRARSFDVVMVSLPILLLASGKQDAVLLQDAARHLDREVARVAKYVLDSGVGLIITAPHPSPDIQTGEYPNIPVPFILAASDRAKNLVATATDYFAQSGFLADMVLARNSVADVAPTILDVLNISKPANMTGQSLLSHLR